MKTRWINGLVLLCILLVGLALGNCIIAEPKVDESNPEYLKVMGHLKEIAKEAHPSGSSEIEQVREYLIGELEKMGCDYSLDSFMAGNQDVPYVNILVTLDVPNSTDAVMLLSHYDSVFRGPGAADDGISVAAMLVALEQSMSAYENGELKNDMYFMFTDGEEVGLQGAKRFVTNNPKMKENIKLVANFEARGNEGALLMFQTSQNNHQLVRQLKKAVGSVDAFSFANSVYQIMPNNTDLTEFLNAGYTSCLNFAMVDGHEHYHQITDSYENISRDSSYMYYETVTQVADYFGTADLNLLKDEEDGIFFSVPGGSIFVCRMSVAKAIVIVILVVSLFWMIFLGKKEKLQDKRLTPAFEFLKWILMGALLLDALCLVISSYIIGNDMSKIQYAKLVDGTYTCMTILICVGVTLLTLRKSIDKKLYQNHLQGAMVCCMLVEAILLIFVDSLLYLLLGSLVILLVQSVVNYYMKDGKGKWINWIFIMLMMLSVSVTIYPSCKLVFDSLGENAILYLGVLEAFGAYLVAVSYMSVIRCNGRN